MSSFHKLKCLQSIFIFLKIACDFSYFVTWAPEHTIILGSCPSLRRDRYRLGFLNVWFLPLRMNCCRRNRHLVSLTNCSGLNENAPPWTHVFEWLVPSWWKCFWDGLEGMILLEIVTRGRL